MQGSSAGSDPADEDSKKEISTDLQLPREVVQRLRDVVFGFDTFFVTKTQNYQANGVLFGGNLRGDPAKSFEKMKARLKVCAAGFTCFAVSFCSCASAVDTYIMPLAVSRLSGDIIAPEIAVQTELGDAYRLFLLQDQQESPVVRMTTRPSRHQRCFSGNAAAVLNCCVLL
jgi:hypothetical protein